MINTLLQPSLYSAAYSNIPVSFGSPDSGLDNYSYLVNICYDDTTISNMVAYTIGSNIYTKVTTAGHSFVKGDSIFIFKNQYVGYYTVTDVLDSTNIIIDLVLGASYDTTLAVRSGVCKYIKYKISPDPSGIVTLDLARTIKDFVESEIIDGDIAFDASSTKFTYFLTIGEQFTYSLRFEDNGFIDGNTGFINSTITSMDNIPFQVGDIITIQQDLAKWNYTDNYFGPGLGFVSGASHNFEVGDLITVTGQTTADYYNGAARVISVPDEFRLIVDKEHTVDTPTEGGSIFGVPVPEYNTSAKITNIYIDPVAGLVIGTDIPFEGSTQPIGGLITYTDNTVSQNLAEDVTEKFYAYASRLDREDLIELGGYTQNIFGDNYVLGEGDKICTIANNYNADRIKVNFNRIELSSKSWLLAHSTSPLQTVQYTFYNSYANWLSNTPDGVSILDDITTADAYFPVGIFQLAGNVDRVDVGVFDLQADFPDIKYYSITILNGGVPVSKPVHYKVNFDCVGIDTYNLVWKDALGSWLTYPFNYVARESTEVVRSTYYQREGQFAADGSSFGLPNNIGAERSFYTHSRGRFSLTSGWVTNYENKLFKDLIKSTEVYIQKPNSSIGTLVPGDYLVDENGDYITDELGGFIIIGSDAHFEYLSAASMLLPVIMETNTIDFKTVETDSVFNYSPVIRLAYNDYRF